MVIFAIRFSLDFCVNELQLFFTSHGQKFFPGSLLQVSILQPRLIYNNFTKFFVHKKCLKNNIVQFKIWKKRQYMKQKKS